MDTGQWVIELRREFHRFPEPSLHENRTAARVEEILSSLGIETHRVAGTGVLGRLRGGKGRGRVVALRADMDALELTEKTGLSFASENPGIMHACGHDGHTAMLLGAAKVLAEQKESLKGDVVFLFQPAEEVMQGARGMVEAGALKGVDAVFGIHAWRDLPTGKIAVQPGPLLAGIDIFKVIVRGKGGHGSMPHQGIDTITPACLAVLGLHAIVSRELDARNPVVLSVGQIHGGTRFNIIADETWFDGSMRYFDPEISDMVEQKIARVVRSTAEAHRTTAEVQYTKGALPTINDSCLAELAREVVGREIGEDCLTRVKPVTGSEDFPYLTAHVPGMYVFLGVGNEAKGAAYPHHHSQFTLDEDALELGTRLHAGFARAFLSG